MSTRELAGGRRRQPGHGGALPPPARIGDFDALRASIQDRINLDLTGVERLRTLPAGTPRSPAALLRRIVESDIASLQALAHTFSEPELERFVTDLLEAQRVAVLGFRFLSPLAHYLAYSLSKLRPDVRAYTHADSTLYDAVRLMGGRDVVVALACARYPADLVALTRYARRCGVRLLAITDSPLSPLVSQAQVTLFARSSMLDFVGSLAAPAALINCIVSELGLRLGESAVARLAAAEDHRRGGDLRRLWGRDAGRPFSPAGSEGPSGPSASLQRRRASFQGQPEQPGQRTRPSERSSDQIASSSSAGARGPQEGCHQTAELRPQLGGRGNGVGVAGAATTGERARLPSKVSSSTQASARVGEGGLERVVQEQLHPRGQGPPGRVGQGLAQNLGRTDGAVEERAAATGQGRLNCASSVVRGAAGRRCSAASNVCTRTRATSDGAAPRRRPASSAPSTAGCAHRQQA